MIAETDNSLRYVSDAHPGFAATGLGMDFSIATLTTR